ncbi:ABC transporter permease [Deinococcus arcticus]|uniref:ABC transporter permease n=2 Tax=Deinococcus arcticus TaxID=2136176 RepID=A0A2T3WAQ3_9DEIO|nr:ABC transporter permease [Deinococcus arcticus]PTA68912.1 ABC transporter permease [Deinococcus arcticus]
MLVGAWLPWVLLRPNRLAPGEALGLPLGWALLAAALALLPALFGHARRTWVWAGAALSLTLGLWLLGQQTQGALAGQPPFARASASSGAWLYLLGAGIAAFGAAQAWPQRRGLGWVWLLPAGGLAVAGHFGAWSVVVEAQSEGARWVQELGQHLRLVGTALGLATLLGTPLAVWGAGRPRVAAAALGLSSGLQTLPSLALLGLLIAPLSALADAVPALRAAGLSGIGVPPALTALTLYALLPVVRGGLLGLQGVPAGVLDAARGMGMTQVQRLWRVQAPLALPLWLGGLRQASVLLIGVAAVAALIGAGGLGTYIFKGLQSAASDLILLGAVPAALLAIGVDAGLRRLEGWLGARLGRAG